MGRRRYRAPAAERPGSSASARAVQRPRGPAPAAADGPGFAPARGPGRTGATFGYMYWCVVTTLLTHLPVSSHVPFVTVRPQAWAVLVVEHSSLRSVVRI